MNMMRGMIMAGMDMGYMIMKEKIWTTRLVLWNVVIVGIAISKVNAWLIVFSSTNYESEELSGVNGR